MRAQDDGDGDKVGGQATAMVMKRAVAMARGWRARMQAMARAARAMAMVR